MKKKKESFSDQLRMAVKQSEHSLNAISRETGIDKSVLSKFVRGLRGMSLDSVDVLTEYLGLRLVTDDEPKRKGGK